MGKANARASTRASEGGKPGHAAGHADQGVHLAATAQRCIDHPRPVAHKPGRADVHEDRAEQRSRVLDTGIDALASRQALPILSYHITWGGATTAATGNTMRALSCNTGANWRRQPGPPACAEQWPAQP
eukprot:5008090-Alexandrium_andersonii.AAC.1